MPKAKTPNTNSIDLKYLIDDPSGSDRLQSLVDDATITSVQQTLIENKQAELKTARAAAKTALDKWANDNGNDTQYLMGFDGSGRMGHGLGEPDTSVNNN